MVDHDVICIQETELSADDEKHLNLDKDHFDYEFKEGYPSMTSEKKYW